VSGQHGGNARSVYEAAAGAFSLSPNGLWIAYVDPGSSTMRLVEVATGRTKPIGAASQVRPFWAPDSSFVLFQRMSGTSGEDVVRVPADGTGATLVMRGYRGRVMPDGRSVVAAPIIAAPGNTVAWFADKSMLRGSQTVMVTEVCPAATGVYFADGGGIVKAGAAPSAPSLRYIGYDGKGERVVVRSPASGSRAAFGSLALSPDGAWLVYAETGDDGFSRLFALKTAGGAPVALTPRLDGYFMNWSSDGSEIFLVEGNAIQGEATRVSAIRPDGGGHRVVVEGGGF
jgi:Tol biopolymer transport system component